MEDKYEFIKEQLKGSAYDFLRNDEKLKDNMMLLTLGGSYAYGTNINTKDHVSDVDIRGIRANSLREILTMNEDNSPYERNDELDVVIYPLKQIVSLLTSCNPNTLEILGTDDSQILYLSNEGKQLRDNHDLFLSQKVYGSFYGYSIQQLRRLQNALARGTYSPTEKENHIKKAVEAKIIAFKDKYKKITGENLKIELKDSLKENFDKELFVDFNLHDYPLRDLKNMIGEMHQIVNNFDKLNHRNSKKDEQHLLKHAMHLIRLLIMGKDILEGRGIITLRPERKFLIDIRMGKYTYEQIFDMADKYEKELKYAYKNTCLPEYPDYNKINEFVYELNKSLYIKK